MHKGISVLAKNYILILSFEGGTDRQIVYNTQELAS